MDNENLGVNEPGVAEPVEGVNVSEVADQTEGQETPPDDGHSASEAWANMRRESAEARRRAEEAERQLAELQAREEARSRAISRFSGSEDGDIAALAESMELEPTDLLAAIEAEQNSAMKDREIERLNEQITNISVEKQMQEDLAALQKLDPEIKDLTSLGEDFQKYISAGLSAENAYYAVKSKEAATKRTPPAEIGKVNSKPPEKDFFTEAEVQAMTPQQRYDNADKIFNSLKVWGKK